MNRHLATLAAILSVAVLLLAARGQTYHRVNAGGTTLRLLQAGQGGPTVIFEAGAGGPLETWARVQPGVSRFARTIAYDRAGNGLSDKGVAPRDGRRIATELHAALQQARAVPPYVLVGHSLGGPYIRVFAGLYPEEVAGLVLVDPTQEDLIAWAKARDPQPAAERKYRPENEVDCAPATFAQAQALPLSPQLPVVLISGLGPREAPGFLTAEFREEVRKDQAENYPAKLRFHREWVESLPRGRLITTDRSGHGIPYEEPELVIQTIRELVQRVRAP
jgi:pimeloyl-ACP methyl ester carboxylesterase